MGGDWAMGRAGSGPVGGGRKGGGRDRPVKLIGGIGRDIFELPIVRGLILAGRVRSGMVGTSGK
jgi:hypothetical protein